MRVAWFHPFSGIAGDMALGSLIDAGADVAAITEILRGLDLPGWKLETQDVLRGGIGGTKAHVRFEASPVVRTAASIDALVAGALLPDRVRNRARLVFAALAAAEARLHRSTPARVHFHEVGGLDAIIDVVGTCAALEVLDIDTVMSGPVTTGTGMVRAAHGIIPNPAPAVVALLHGAPTRGIDESVELTTPTGAALLAGLVDDWGPMPSMTIDAHGFGAGTKELDHRPNLTQVVIGELDATRLDPGQTTMVLSTNVDDVTGEVLSHTMSKLLDAGAKDVWITPVIMKKGRPGQVISVLADLADADRLRAILVDETGSLGVRGHQVERWPMPRQLETLYTADGPAVVKVAPHHAKIEYEDAARIASGRREPLVNVLEELEAAWRQGHDHAHEHEHGHDHPHGHHWEEEGPADPVA